MASPSRPVTRMAAYIFTMAEARPMARCSAMKAPSPSEPPARMPTVMMTMSTIDDEILTPVAMNGPAAGMTTRPMTPAREVPNTLAMSFALGSTPRTPYMVLKRMGHTAAYIAMTICISSVWPRASITSGMSATAGMVRTSSMGARAPR